MIPNARRKLRSVLALWAMAFFLFGAADAMAATLPPGFQDEVVLETNEPGRNYATAFKFAPNGSIFVATKGGKILVYPPGARRASEAAVFADLAKQTYDWGDHGLLGLALDPEFGNGRPYVYALYTYNHELGAPSFQMPRWPSSGSGVSEWEGDECSEDNRCVVSGRLVRLTAEGDHAKQAGGEPQQTVLLEGWCQQSSSHSIGDLSFGPEGALYASGGEGGIYVNADYGQYENLCGDPNGTKGTNMPLTPAAEGGSLRSQSLLRPDGDVLLSGTLDRIDPDTGQGWPGNPEAGSANANARRIVGIGFRNPFRFVVSPRLGDVFVGNVGSATSEELDRVPIGGPIYNSGWPCYEGTGIDWEFQVLGLNACERLYGTPGSTSQPFFSYSHGGSVAPGEGCDSSSGSAISGQAFYEGSTYPAAYDDALFFADSVRGCIYVMLAGGPNREPDPTKVQPFLTGDASEYPGVDIEQGPDGSIYYASLVYGTVNKIAYDPTAVTARLKTTGGEPWGDVPLTVHFDAGESNGPTGDPLAYEWDLNGDGKFEVGEGPNSPTAQGTYSDGSKNVQVAVRVKDTVTDNSAIERLTVYPGDAPPQVTILEPSASRTWGVGEQIKFKGTAQARGGKGAALPAADLTWTARLLHCPTSPTSCHEHPIQEIPGVAEGTILAPDHNYPTYINFILSATDSRGMTTEASRKITARPVAMQIRSEPPGIGIGIGETRVTTPAEFVAVEGSRTSAAAPEEAVVGGARYVFERWSDGGPRVHDLSSTEPGTYTAIYREVGDPTPPGGGEGGSGSGAGGSGGVAGVGPVASGAVARPKLTRHPPKETRSTTAKFGFDGPAGAGFRCKLDRLESTFCRSPRIFRRLKPGPHTLRLVAVDLDGRRSPATVFSWKVVPGP